MSAETALRALLAATAGVTALVPVARIAIDRVEEKTPYPLIVLARSASLPQTCLDGSVLATQVSLEVQCWAETFVSASAVADAVTAAVRAVLPHQVSARVGGYDADLDRTVASLTVDWWE